MNKLNTREKYFGSESVNFYFIYSFTQETNHVLSWASNYVSFGENRLNTLQISGMDDE